MIEREDIKRKLTEEITKLEKDYKKVWDDKENDEWNKIDEIKEHNKEQLYKVTKEGLNSKAELTITNNKF